MKAKLLFAAAAAAILFAPIASAQKAIPAPTYKPGDTFFYLIHFKSNHDIKTKSAMVIPQQPMAAVINVTGILRVEVISGDASSNSTGEHLRTWFLNLVSDVESHPRGAKPNTVLSQHERIPAEGKFVDCTLQPGGQIVQIQGLDQLASEQQTAWREWAARFSAASLFASRLRKRGEKWSGGEPENSPSPIAELLWQQRSQYAKDESCGPRQFARNGSLERSGAQENCAVILTTAALVQKSSTQDSTPADYKLKGLKTRGIAKGTNETILYISRKTGQLIRATLDAKQQMDVQIALADGTNQLHYAITASANSTVELVTELPFRPRPDPK